MGNTFKMERVKPWIHILNVLFVIMWGFPYISAQCALNGNVIVGSARCDYDISATGSFYTDSTFSSKLEAPILLRDNEFVHVGFHLVNTSLPTNNLLLETCWATVTRDHVPINLTIVDFPGCSSRQWKSVISLTNNSRSDNVTLRFPTFYLHPDNSEFYIHCTIGACGNCPLDECNLPNKIKQTFTRTVDVITLGPIRRNIDTAVDVTHESPALLIATLVLSSVVLFLIVIVVLYLAHGPHRRRQLLRQEAKGYNAPVLTSNKTVQSTYSVKHMTSSTDSPETDKNTSDDVYAEVIKNKKTEQNNV